MLLYAYKPMYIHRYIRMYLYMSMYIVETVHNITENFQLGFGSFVDKPRVPYISVEPSRSVDICMY